MDLSSIIGILFSFGMLILGYLLEKGQISALFLVSPAVIVFGGTAGAIMLSYSMNEIKKVPKIVLEAFTFPKNRTKQIIDFLVSLSESARKNGLLSLEGMLQTPEAKKIIDPFLEHGVLMIIDGVQIDNIRDTLDNEIRVYEQKKKIEFSIFEAAGGYSPTLGIIGTVMGLIQVLSNMSSPEELSKSIAVAFIATLYGVCFANLVYLPIASKLKLRLKYYRTEKEMIVDGICALGSGVIPKELNERLSVYLTKTKNIKTAKKSKK